MEMTPARKWMCLVPAAMQATPPPRVVLADYRLYPQVRYPDFIVDSARAVHAANRSPHVLLAAAARDLVVNLERNTLGLAAALRSSGTPVTVRIYENASHVSILAALARPLRAIAPVVEDSRT